MILNWNLDWEIETCEDIFGNIDIYIVLFIDFMFDTFNKMIYVALITVVMRATYLIFPFFAFLFKNLYNIDVISSFNV